MRPEDANAPAATGAEGLPRSRAQQIVGHEETAVKTETADLVGTADATLRRLSPVAGLFVFQVEARKDGSATIKADLTRANREAMQNMAGHHLAGYEVRVVTMARKAVPGEPLLFGDPKASERPKAPEPGHVVPQPPARATTPAATAGPVPELEALPAKAPPRAPATSAESPSTRVKAGPVSVAEKRQPTATKGAAGVMLDGDGQIRYTRVPVSLPDKLRGVSGDAKLLYYTALVGPHRTSLPGLSRAGKGQLADLSGLSARAVERALNELEAAGLVERDIDAHVLYLPLAPHDDLPKNPNQKKAWRRALSEMPDCALMQRITPKLIAVGGLADERDGNSSTSSLDNRSGNSSGNGSPTQIQIHGQEQIHLHPQGQGRTEGPPLEEVLDFARLQGIQEEWARTYHGKRTETGWKIGGNPVVDWKTGLCTWAARDARDAAAGPSSPARSGSGALPGKSSSPPPAIKRTPGPDSPAEVRSAYEKKLARDRGLEDENASKAPPWLPAAHYGQGSRSDEEVRLKEWMFGDDEAFIRNRTHPGGDE